MSEWEEVQVGDLCQIKHGYAFKGEHFEDAGHFLLLTPGNFLAEGGLQIRDGNETFYSGEFPDDYLLEQGDLVVAMTDLKQDAPILGSTLRIPESGRFLHNQRLGLVQNVSEKVDPVFLYYLLNDQSVRWWLRATATGSTVRHTAPERIHQAKVRVPPMPTQQKIGAPLRDLDELIENNRRRIEILEEMARLLYREWFVHFRFPGHEDVELLDSDLGPIPVGWETAKLSHLVSTQYGYTESASSEPVGPRYLRGMDLNKNSFIDWSTVPYCPISTLDHQKFAVQVGDVFVIRMADPGKVGICEREVDAVFASYLVRLRPSNGRITPYYLFFALSDEPYQGWVTGASTGATRKSVSAKVMTEPDVVVPCDVVLEQFDEAVRPMRSLINNLLEQNAILRDTSDLLLPRLMSGELDVSEFDFGLEALGV